MIGHPNFLLIIKLYRSRHTKKYGKSNTIDISFKMDGKMGTNQ